VARFPHDNSSLSIRVARGIREGLDRFEDIEAKVDALRQLT